jgi:ATP-binding cassette, subfamily B, bacterial PglK
VLDTIKKSLGFMTTSEKLRYYFFLALRALVGLLDLAAILAIGFLTSSLAIFITEEGAESTIIELGPIKLPTMEIDLIPIVGGLTLILFVVKAIISIFLMHKLAQFLARIEARAARDVTKKAFGRGLEEVKQHSRNEILFAVQTGSPSIFNTLLNAVGVLVAEGFLFLLVIASFAIISPGAAVVTLLYFVFIGVTIQYFIGRQLEKTSSKIAQYSIISNGSLLDLSEVVREVSTFGKIDFFTNNLYNARLAAARNLATQLVLQGAPRHIVETALILGISGFILVQSLSGDLAGAVAVTGVFLVGGLRLTAALLPLQSAFLAIKQSIPIASSALSFLNLPDIDETSVNSHPVEIRHISAVAVSTTNLGFKFRGSAEKVLEDVSIEIPEGAQAAFIGPSGAGKSTLADLILGLLQPTTGNVLLDGLSPLNWARSQPGLLGYVPQRPGMISGTIVDNIALGVEPTDIDYERLNKAIEDAHLSELIKSLPNGVMTDLGNAKDDLSGGQLQRIGLARALYPQPRLLIMDEATSALDAESESEINKALDEMRGRVTVILIAHRLNTVQRSDQVFLLVGGRITASGTFPELMRTNSTVRNLAKLMSIDSED